MAEPERVQFMGDEDPKFFFARISRLETTMRAVGIKNESEIVQIILRQLPERYDVVKTTTLADPQLTRQRLENTIRSAFSQRKAHEIAKQWPAVGGGMLRQQLQQHWTRDGGMPRQQQLQQHWSRDGSMPRQQQQQQQQQQQHWSRGGGMPRQQQQQQQWSRGGGIPHQHQRSSHDFPPVRQARQQQPLQQPSRGIPTIESDGEDGSSPLSETFFGGDGGAVQEWLQGENVEMPMFSLLEGLQQSAPTAVALAAAAPAAEAMTGTRIFPGVSSKVVAEAPTSSAGAAPAAVPAAAPATGGTVSPTASVGEAARALSSADKAAALTAAPATSGTVPSAAPMRGVVGARESSAGAASSDAAAEAAPSTGDNAAPDASVERADRKLTLEESSAGVAPSDVVAEAFPLEVRYYNSSWPKHGSNSNSSSSSNSSGNGSSSSSNDTPSNHDSWWEATCVVALLRLFDPGKGCRRSARRGKAVLGLDLPFDRGKAWRECSMEGDGLRAEGEFLAFIWLVSRTTAFLAVGLHS